MTMTRENAAKILVDRRRRANNVIRAKTSRGMNTTADRAEAEALTIAIAALSAQDAAPPAQADTKQAEPCPWVRQSSEGTAYCELAESGAKQAEPLSPWLPIESAPRAYSPPISLYNHHAPLILGVHGQSFYFLCRWGGKSKGCWVSDYYEKLPFQPTHWQPLPPPPALHQLGAKVEVSDG